MAQVKQKIKGEYTYPSEYTEIPDGALKSAKNCVINRDSIAEPRRGFNNYKSISSTGSDRSAQLLTYKTDLLSHYGSSISHDGADPFTQLTGTFAAPSHNDSYTPKVKYIEANSNLYFTSNAGIQKEDTVGGAITAAGAPKGLDVKLSLSSGTGFFTDSTQVAYRILWGKKDANNNLILGSPSQRTIIANSAGATRDVIVNFSIPASIDTTWFYQIYRSGISINVTTDPGDELQLVYEANPTATEITNKFISVTDSTPDTLRGASLYTDASQDGIQQANDTPPSAKDIALFKNCVFLANTIQKQNLTVTLLAAAGTAGINYRQVTGDTASGTNTILNLSATTGVAIGQVVSGIGIPAGTTVTNLVGTTATISANATATNATTTLEFADRLTFAGTTYDAYALDRSTSTITVTIAAPAVVTWTANGLQNGSIVKFSTTGALPTGITAGTTYYVVGVAANTFNIAATYGGAAITTTGVQSGVHTAIANDQRFKMASAGTPAQNIEQTAQSICSAVNRSAANTLVYAYYISNADELPGKIFLESRSLGASAFTAWATSHGTAFNPSLPTSGTTVQSQAEGKMNRLHLSKVQQPEAFPRAQYFDVGAQAKAFLRIIPLKDSLILCKEDGFFRLTGTEPSNFTVYPLDLTTILIAPETACTGNNQIFCLSNQGIATVTDTGVGVISRPIEDQLNPLLNYSNVRTTAFAFFYDTERQYIISVPTASTDTYAKKQHVYNTFTQAWSHWFRNATCGLINPNDNKMYFGSPTSNKLVQERKNNDYTDFADEDLAVTITAVSGTSVTLSDVTGVSIGDALSQGSLPFANVTAINVATNVLTMDVARGWSVAVATIRTSYECKVSFSSQYCQNPGIVKHIREVHAFFKTVVFSKAKLGFSSDIILGEDTVDINGFESFLWGFFGWGEIPWGGYTDLFKIRTWPHSDYQRCTWMNVSFIMQLAYGQFALAGLEYTFEPLTERTTL